MFRHFIPIPDDLEGRTVRHHPEKQNPERHVQQKDTRQHRRKEADTHKRLISALATQGKGRKDVVGDMGQQHRFDDMAFEKQKPIAGRPNQTQGLIADRFGVLLNVPQEPVMDEVFGLIGGKTVPHWITGKQACHPIIEDAILEQFVVTRLMQQVHQRPHARANDDDRENVGDGVHLQPDGQSDDSADDEPVAANEKEVMPVILLFKRHELAIDVIGNVFFVPFAQEGSLQCWHVKRVRRRGDQDLT